MKCTFKRVYECVFFVCFNYFSVSLVFFAFLLFIKCYHFLLVFRARPLFNDNFAPIQLIRLNLDLCVSAVWFIPSSVCVFFRFVSFFANGLIAFQPGVGSGMVPLISRLPELMVFGSEMFCVGFLCEFFFCSVKLYCLFGRWKRGGGGFFFNIHDLY